MDKIKYSDFFKYEITLSLSFVLALGVRELLLILFGVFGVTGVFGVRGVESGLMLEKLDAEHRFVPSRAWRTPSPLG